MSMIIYCNLCFETQSQVKRNFFITCCSHVFCESCQSNAKNFCKLCNAQCRVLEINEKMPSEVKMYFEPKSIEKLAHSIQKIRNFQENQVKFYYDKTKPFIKKYQETKQKALKLHSIKKKYMEEIQKEKKLMERLKQAYHSNKITPDLFKLCHFKSPSEISHRNININQRSSAQGSTPRSSNNSGTNFNYTPKRASTNGSSSLTSTSLSVRNQRAPSLVSLPTRSSRISPLADAGPSARYSRTPPMESQGTSYRNSGAQSKNSFGMSSRTSDSDMMKTPSNSSMSIFLKSRSDPSTTSSLVPRLTNLNTNSPSPKQSTSGSSSTSTPRSIFRDTRKSLLQNTLRQMQKASQMKYQASRQE